MGDYEPRLEILRAFKKVQDVMRRHFEAKFKDFGMTGPQAFLVSVLSHQGPMKVSDISERMHLSNSTVSSIIDRLEAQGHVVRVRSNEDKRVVVVALTEAFKSQAKHKFCNIDEEMGSILSQASAEQQAKILEGLTLLASLMDEQREATRCSSKADGGERR